MLERKLPEIGLLVLVFIRRSETRPKCGAGQRSTNFCIPFPLWAQLKNRGHLPRILPRLGTRRELLRLLSMRKRTHFGGVLSSRPTRSKLCNGIT